MQCNVMHCKYLTQTATQRHIIGIEHYGIITKLPELGVLCDNITEFGVVGDYLSPQGKVTQRYPKQSDIDI